MPLAFVRVDVLNSTSGEPLKDINGNPSTNILTDANGNFTFGPIYAPRGCWVNLKIYSRNDAAIVVDPGREIIDPYSRQMEIPEFVSVGENKTITYTYLDTEHSQNIAEFVHPWTILSYHSGVTRGWCYIFDETDSIIPQAIVRYPNQTGPFYDFTTEEIVLPWGVEPFPDVILHEYAHSVMNMCYGYFPPVMLKHSIEKKSNLTTAWVEGWADSFPLPVFNRTTLKSFPYGEVYDLEVPTWCWSQYGWEDGDEVEGRVAGALQDIFDSHNDGNDTFSDGFSRIWNIMQTQPSNTFRGFWQAWNTSGYQKQPALMAIFQNTIDYRGKGDVDADGNVTILDQIILAKAFGFKKGDSKFDKRADLNYDDTVNILDAIIFANYFGKHYDC